MHRILIFSLFVMPCFSMGSVPSTQRSQQDSADLAVATPDTQSPPMQLKKKPSLKFVLVGTDGTPREIDCSKNSARESVSSKNYKTDSESPSSIDARNVSKPHVTSRSSNYRRVSDRWKKKVTLPDLVLPNVPPDADGMQLESASRSGSPKKKTSGRITYTNIPVYHYNQMIEHLGNVIEIIAKSKYLNSQRAQKQGVPVEQYLKDFLTAKAKENKKHYEQMGEFKELLPAAIDLIVKTYLLQVSPASGSKVIAAVPETERPKTTFVRFGLNSDSLPVPKGKQRTIPANDCLCCIIS